MSQFTSQSSVPPSTDPQESTAPTTQPGESSSSTEPTQTQQQQEQTPQPQSQQPQGQQAPTYTGGLGPLPPGADGQITYDAQGMPIPLMKKDKTLKDFLGMMDECAPIIPDAVTDYYLSLSGLTTPDVRLKRLLALATQKFISEIAADAFQYSKVRQGGGQGGGGGAVGGVPGGPGGPIPGMAQIAGEGKKGTRNVLTLEDLGCAVSEYGVDVRRGEFYR